MKVEVFYDVICSWCRIGKVNLHKAIDKLVKEGKIKEKDIEIVFRGYMIYPDLPGGSTDVKVGGDHPALVRAQVGGDYKAIQVANDDTADWAPEKNTPLHRWAARAGMNFELTRISVKPNTMQAHQMLYIVREVKPEAFEPLLADMQQAYFEDGLDMGNLDVICALAKKYVNDIWPLRERVLKGDYAADVKRDTDEIGDTKYDCQMCPMFVFDEKVVLEGAVLQASFEKALLGQPVSGARIIE